MDAVPESGQSGPNSHLTTDFNDSHFVNTSSFKALPIKNTNTQQQALKTKASNGSFIRIPFGSRSTFNSTQIGSPSSILSDVSRYGHPLKQETEWKDPILRTPDISLQELILPNHTSSTHVHDEDWTGSEIQPRFHSSDLSKESWNFDKTTSDVLPAFQDTMTAPEREAIAHRFEDIMNRFHENTHYAKTIGAKADFLRYLFN